MLDQLRAFKDIFRIKHITYNLYTIYINIVQTSIRHPKSVVCGPSFWSNYSFETLRESMSHWACHWHFSPFLSLMPFLLKPPLPGLIVRVRGLSFGRFVGMPYSFHFMMIDLRILHRVINFLDIFFNDPSPFVLLLNFVSDLFGELLGLHGVAGLVVRKRPKGVNNFHGEGPTLTYTFILGWLAIQGQNKNIQILCRLDCKSETHSITCVAFFSGFAGIKISMHTKGKMTPLSLLFCT